MNTWADRFHQPPASHRPSVSITGKPSTACLFRSMSQTSAMASCRWMQAPAGTHPLGITVRGNLKNLMGPHVAGGRPGGWTWERSPESCPPGEAYRITPTGLRSAPEIRIE